MLRRLPPRFRLVYRASLVLAMALLCGGLAGCDAERKPGDSSTKSRLSGDVGSACTSAASCKDGFACLTQLTGGAGYALVAEPLAAPGGYCSKECSDHEDCGPEGLCFGRGLLGGGGECRRACTQNRDCDDGQECASAGSLSSSLLPDTCQPLPPVGQLEPQEAGRFCENDTDCSAGQCAEAQHRDGGYCTGQCAADDDCGAGGVCQRGIYGSGGLCRERCTEDADCQNDSAGWGCGVGGLCAREPNPLASVGDACTAENAAETCKHGSCRTADFGGLRYPDGYCLGSCDEDDDCGAEGICINNLTCFKRCEKSKDCRGGYDCRAHPQALGSDRDTAVCYPSSMSSSIDR